MDYAALKPYAATDAQKKVLNALIEHGSQLKAAKALGIHRKTVFDNLRRVEKRAAKVEPEMHERKAPAGYVLRGASTLLDGNGKVVQRWVKTARDHQDPGEFLELFKAAVEEAPPPVRAMIPRASRFEEDLLALYPMGDPHLGMLAHRAESGDDFDLKIAERNLCAAVQHLVQIAPPSKEALIVNVGDFLHADSSSATTTAGTRVDVDSRWAKVLRAGIATLIRCVDLALEKHETVRVINEIGNHDAHSAIMLSTCMDYHYRDNPRVSIDMSPSKFHWYEFGLNLIGVTHGDTVKLDQLPGIMAHDRAEAWGRTKHRYWLTGHVHHQSVREYPGCLVETFRTLAAKDAWHSGQGYRSGRSMIVDVLHRTRGRITRHEIGVEDL